MPSVVIVATRCRVANLIVDLPISLVITLFLREKLRAGWTPVHARLKCPVRLRYAVLYDVAQEAVCTGSSSNRTAVLFRECEKARHLCLTTTMKQNMTLIA